MRRPMMLVSDVVIAVAFADPAMVVVLPWIAAMVAVVAGKCPADVPSDSVADKCD
jgi:hypothetical protein